MSPGISDAVTFTNLDVDLETLPRYDAVELRRPEPRYRFVVLGVAVSIELVVLAILFGAILANPEPRAFLAGPPGLLAGAGALAVAAFLAWFAYKSAGVIRYAVRQHDVIVHKGVFFKRETVQPIRRIQHVEQLQGPVDRRFGLYKIRLFSAGTAHFAFEIPGLSAETAARVRQAILRLRESKLAKAPAAGGAPLETAPHAAAEPGSAADAELAPGAGRRDDR